MAKKQTTVWAWVENNIIKDIVTVDPFSIYKPELALYYNIQVPADTKIGSINNNGKWELPKQIIPISPADFKLLFTSSERITIKRERSQDDMIDDFYDIIEDQRLENIDLNSKTVSDYIDHLVAQKILSAERAKEVLSGKRI